MCGKTFIPITLIVLIISFCAEVQAVTDFRIAGISGRIAYVKIEKPVGNTVSFGGSVNLGNINTNAYLRVDVLYWSEIYDPFYSNHENLDFSDLATKINIKYQIPCDEIIPYVGAGLTIHKHFWSYTCRNSPNLTRTRVGFQGFIGAEFPMLNNVYWFWEAAFDRSDRDQYFFGGGVGYRIK